MIRVCCLVLSCASVAVAGCSAPPPWSKAGLSQADVQAQEDACWNYVLNTPEGRQKVYALRAFWVVTGGPVLLLTFNKKNPKDESANSLIFSKCMTDHGFARSRGAKATGDESKT